MENKGNIEQEFNADRHLCKTCCYRASVKGNNLKNKCNYFLITGELRRCKVSECNKYIKGAKKRQNKKESLMVRRLNNGYVQKGYHKAGKEVWN